MARKLLDAGGTAKTNSAGWFLKDSTRHEWKPLRGYFPGDLVPYGAYFALKNAQGVVVPWVPSVGDLLACDWFVVE